MDDPKTSAGNKIFDDLSRMMTNAMGVAHGAKTEAENAMKGFIDRWVADRDLVTRDEFEAVREMAIKARAENTELRARLDTLEGKAASEKSGATTTTATTNVPTGGETR